MIVANQRQIELKVQRQAAIAAEEERLRQAMLDKFAEDDRVEQMNAQKRRMKTLEHRREVLYFALCRPVTVHLVWYKQPRVLKGAAAVGNPDGNGILLLIIG